MCLFKFYITFNNPSFISQNHLHECFASQKYHGSDTWYETPVMQGSKNLLVIMIASCCRWVKILNFVNVNYQIHHSIWHIWWCRTSDSFKNFQALVSQIILTPAQPVLPLLCKYEHQERCSLYHWYVTNWIWTHDLSNPIWKLNYNVVVLSGLVPCYLFPDTDNANWATLGYQQQYKKCCCCIGVLRPFNTF